MRKSWLMLLILPVLWLGCGESSPSRKSEEVKTEQPTVPALYAMPIVPADYKTVDLGNAPVPLKLQVPQNSVAFEGTDPEKGNQYVAFVNLGGANMFRINQGGLDPKARLTELVNAEDPPKLFEQVFATEGALIYSMGGLLEQPVYGILATKTVNGHAFSLEHAGGYQDLSSGNQVNWSIEDLKSHLAIFNSLQ